MKIYHQNFSTLAKAAGKALFNDIVIAAGESYFLAVPGPYEGILESLICKQTAGTNVGFKVTMYESNLGLTEGSAAHSLPAWAPLYQITPEVTGTSGTALEEYTTNVDNTFRNADGTQSVPKRFIYAHIKPTAAAGETSWQLSVRCRSEIG